MSVENLSKKEIISKYGEHATNTGDTRVQVALLTKRINHLSKHLSTNKKDHSTRRALLAMVGKRRKRLRYLHDTNLESYRELIKNLELRH